MSGIEPFEPDDVYCVHCHAPAAGVCARCGSLCCGDCVELRLGMTRHLAVCRVCLAAEGPRDQAGWSSRRGVALVVGLALALSLLWRWAAT